MHDEITEAIDFVGRLLQSKLDPTVIRAFKEKLYTILSERFINHWDVANPYKGNGFRAISNFNGQLDPIFALAANQVGISPMMILAHLPNEFVLWVDPSSVSYRVGDHGNIMNLFTNGKSLKDKRQAFKQSTSTTSTPIRISPPPSPASNDKNVQQQQKSTTTTTTTTTTSPLALHTKKDQQQVASSSPRHKPMVLVH